MRLKNEKKAQKAVPITERHPSKKSQAGIANAACVVTGHVFEIFKKIILWNDDRISCL